MRTRVGLAMPGDPRDPTTWSGTPRGVLEGFEAIGIGVAPLDVDVPELASRIATRLSAADALAPVHSALGSLALRRAGPLAGVVQVGTAFVLPARARTALLFDMTLRQGRDLGDPWVLAHGRRSLAAWERRQRRVYRTVTVCCAASAWAAQSVIEDYGVAPERVRIVGLGRNHEPSVRERDFSAPRFLFIGREWERKGGPELLRSFAHLRAERPDAELDLVGGHPAVQAPGVTAHGPLRLADPGQRERVEALLAQATCFVMPSRYEPFGIAHVEAGAAGLPSIGTTVGGAREIFGTDGGIAVTPGDEPGLLDALRTLSDARVAAHMGVAARARAGGFTWPRVAEKIASALEFPRSPEWSR